MRGHSVEEIRAKVQNADFMCRVLQTHRIRFGAEAQCKLSRLVGGNQSTLKPNAHHCQRFRLSAYYFYAQSPNLNPQPKPYTWWSLGTSGGC